MSVDIHSKISGAFIAPFQRARIYTVVAAYCRAGFEVRDALEALASSYEGISDRKDALAAIRSALSPIKGSRPEAGDLLMALLAAFKNSLPEEYAILSATPRAGDKGLASLVSATAASLSNISASEIRR